MDVGIKRGHCVDRVAGTLAAYDAVDVGIKRGRCDDRPAGTLELLGRDLVTIELLER